MRQVPTAILIGLVLTACTPAMDWRQVAPAGLGVFAEFPCRPASRTREIQLRGQRVTMALLACSVGGTTFAISTADVGDVFAVGQALEELSSAAARNLGGVAMNGESVQVPGMTPHEQARRFLLVGKLPDGASVEEYTAVFARGTRVYQAFVMGPQPRSQDVQIFFGGLKLGT